MTLELSSTRPAVLSTDTGQRLDEYRKLGHLVRHIYATHLSAARMEHLEENLLPTWHQVRVELLAFADFLERLA